MTSRDFCYWLQGYFELRAADGVNVEPTPEMLELIERHLALVFIHEIDPSAGPASHQKKLNDVHAVEQPASFTGGHASGGGPVFRC